MSNAAWLDELDGLLERSGYQDRLEARTEQALARLETPDAPTGMTREALQEQLFALVLRGEARSAVRAPSMNTRILAEALPAPLKTQLEFKPAPCAVAVVLARMAYPSRFAKVTVAAIVEASHLTRRSVQRALRILEMAGLIDSHSTKLRRDFNEPNMYYLGDAFEQWFKRPAASKIAAHQGGDSNDAQHRDIDSNNQESTYYNQDVSNAPGREQRPVTRKAVDQAPPIYRPSEQELAFEVPSMEAPIEALVISDAPSDWEGLAVRAVKALDPTASDASPWLALDRLRRERLGGFSARHWQAAASRHAHRALLAVAEVLLRPGGYFRVSPLAYLAGVLRKAQVDCAPERSVARILAERNGSAFPVNAPALPMGVKPVEVIDPPEDVARRRIFNAVGSAAYRSWFDDAEVSSHGESVLARLGKQWRVEWVGRQYGSVLRRARIILEPGGAH